MERERKREEEGESERLWHSASNFSRSPEVSSFYTETTKLNEGLVGGCLMKVWERDTVERESREGEQERKEERESREGKQERKKDRKTETREGE